MKNATFRFYGQLNDFLPVQRKLVNFDYSFEHASSIKNVIEILGVPHTEVHLIVVNGEPVDFTYLLRDGDSVSVYPLEPSQNASSPDELRFVLDVHLGRLSAYLRMLGFDTLYPDDYRDEELARISSEEQRILLTRDTGLLKRSIVTLGYYVRETNPQRQLVEIVRHFNLKSAMTPFRRCLSCNGLVDSVEKAAILDQLPEDTRNYYDEFWRCQQCAKIYWKGSHFQRMQQIIDSMLNP
jgi:uncharacterized protein with PIN domain